MRRFIVLLAAAMPTALVIGIATIAAIPAPVALAASTCHDEGDFYDFYDDYGSGVSSAQWWDAQGTTTGKAVESEYILSTPPNMDPPSEWCRVTGVDIDGNASHGTFFMYRLQGTSECATYAGPAAGDAQGVGSVDLQPCDSSVEAQNWSQPMLDSEGEYVYLGTMTTEYQFVNDDANYPLNDSGIPTCLSADNASEASPPTTLLVMVDGCTGSGGQTWYYSG